MYFFVYNYSASCFYTTNIDILMLYFVIKCFVVGFILCNLSQKEFSIV